MKTKQNLHQTEENKRKTKFLLGRVLCATQGLGASRLDLTEYYMNLLKFTCLDLT